MIFERVKTEVIAHNAYLLGSAHQALVVDPGRYCGEYSGLLKKHGLAVKAIFETHCNEDYVQGALELSGITGAPVYHGPGAGWQYGRELADGQTFNIGGLEVTAVFTPGHTDDSVSYVIKDTDTGPGSVMVFTGDALFVNSVGRTDLEGDAEEKRMASSLYRSIFDRLLPLGGHIIICPAHGAGSVCGSHIAERDESTIGLEKIQNPALTAKSEEEFIQQRLAEKTERPSYFSRIRELNLRSVPGCPPLPPALSPREFKKAVGSGAVIVDTREPSSFGGAHIAGAYAIWLEGLPVFAGWVLPYDKPLLLVLEDEIYLEQAVRHLALLGFDRAAGYLRGGVESWYNAALPVESLRLISVNELKDMLESLFVLDVRSQEEWEEGHIETAHHIYVGHLAERLSEVPKGKTVAVLCSVGRRAGLGASILQRAGYPRVQNVIGSMTAWNTAGYPVVR